MDLLGSPFPLLRWLLRQEKAPAVHRENILQGLPGITSSVRQSILQPTLLPPKAAPAATNCNPVVILQRQ